MKLSGNTILITGGSEGIGFELAKTLQQENSVIICGRNENKLLKAKEKIPGITTIVSDVTVEEQRDHLISQAIATHPNLNVLVNNAGGRHITDMTDENDIADSLDVDFALNFFAPVSLCTKLLPHLRNQPSAAIVNVTTGLAFLPKTAYPFYCAAKAALHSYTMSLRLALCDTPVHVYEVLMPLVNTNFHKGKLPTTTRAMTQEEAAKRCIKGLTKDLDEIYIGKSSLARLISFISPKKGMVMINR